MDVTGRIETTLKAAIAAATGRAAAARLAAAMTHARVSRAARGCGPQLSLSVAHGLRRRRARPVERRGRRDRADPLRQPRA